MSLWLLIKRYAAAHSARLSQQKLITLEFFSTILSQSHSRRFSILASFPTPEKVFF
jgi:hypothetical protein